MENGVKMVLFAFLKKDLPAHLVAVRVRPERQKEVFYSYKKKKKKKKKLQQTSLKKDRLVVWINFYQI